MNQPAEQQANIEHFENILKTFDPELYLIYETQKLTKVNWEIIREVMSSIYDVASYTGTGEVRIFILKGTTKAIQGEKNRKMDIPTLIEDLFEKEYNITKAK